MEVNVFTGNYYFSLVKDHLPGFSDHFGPYGEHNIVAAKHKTSLECMNILNCFENVEDEGKKKDDKEKLTRTTTLMWEERKQTITANFIWFFGTNIIFF